MTAKAPGTHMPQRGVKTTDAAGVSLIQTWINGL
jgi:hypothetical protein